MPTRDDLMALGVLIGREWFLLDSESWRDWEEGKGDAPKRGVAKRTASRKASAKAPTAFEKKYLGRWKPPMVGVNDEPKGGWLPQHQFAGRVPLDMTKTNSQYIVRSEQTRDGFVWNGIYDDYVTGVTIEKEHALAKAASDPKYKPMVDLVQRIAREKLDVGSDGYVTLYRGIGDTRVSTDPSKHGPVSSWTTDPKVAEIFAQVGSVDGTHDGVLEARVPVESIIGGSFVDGTKAAVSYSAQKEVTVLGNPKPSKVSKRTKRYSDVEVTQHTHVR